MKSPLDLQTSEKSSFFTFSLIVVTIVLIISFIMAVISYFNAIEDSKKDVYLSATRIDYSLSTFFDEIQPLMLYVGKRIASNEEKDIPTIWRLMKDVLSRTKNTHSQWAWPAFAWLNSENQFGVESNYGIISTHFDYSMLRKYVKASRENPWELHFVDSPLLDIPANYLSLQGGLGVVDSQGNYLGTLNVSFDINELVYRIRQAAEMPSIEFVLYNADSTVILSSLPAEELSSMQNTFVSLVGEIQLTYLDEGLFKKWGFPFSNIAYAKKISGYPFTIITFIRSPTFIGKYFNALYPHFLEIFGMGSVCLLLLYLFWRSIRRKNQELKETKHKLENAISLARASNDAKEEFLRCTNNELMIPLNGMANNTNLLLKNLKNEIDVALVLEKQISLLEGILDHALDFKNLTNNSLDLKLIDLQSTIEECLVILSKAAFDKSIVFSINIEPSLPKLKGDIIKLKRVFVGLLIRAIKYSSNKQKIEISAVQEMKEHELQVTVVIKDHGFGLTEKMVENLETNLDHGQGKEFLEIDFPQIERLIKMHHGTVIRQSNPGKGTIFTLSFPVLDFTALPKENARSGLNILLFSPDA
ncbi:MAG: sensor histidine kinase [Parachlamydiaceae bacterium]|nr:sensor histidine kinase [Parachlamydiaceae bacterium]